MTLVGLKCEITNEHIMSSIISPECLVSGEDFDRFTFFVNT